MTGWIRHSILNGRYRCLRAVTIVTHAAMRDGTSDDVALAEALRKRGHGARFAVWNDGGVDWGVTPLTVIRSTWDYHRTPAAWLAWLRQVSGQTQTVNPASLVAWNSDKAYLLELERAGVPIIPTLLLDGGVDVADACRRRGWDDVVIKPAIGASSTGARRFRDGLIAAAGAEHGRALLSRGRALLQPYQAAIETEHERALVYIGGVFSHAFTKPGFHTALNGDALQRHEPSPEELRLAQQVLAALPESALVARIDVLPGGDGLLLMEAELIEPQLAFHLRLQGADALADLLLDLSGRGAA